MADDGDGDSPLHELEEFLRQDQAEMAAEYQRIFARSSDDPGTAGDEGEENWAAVLRSRTRRRESADHPGRNAFRGAPSRRDSPRSCGTARRRPTTC